MVTVWLLTQWKGRYWVNVLCITKSEAFHFWASITSCLFLSCSLFITFMTNSPAMLQQIFAFQVHLETTHLDLYQHLMTMMLHLVRLAILHINTSCWEQLLKRLLLYALILRVVLSCCVWECATPKMFNLMSRIMNFYLFISRVVVTVIL